MSASRSRRCSRPTLIWPKMPPSWFRSRPTSWRRYWMPAPPPAVSRPACPPRRWCCAPVTATSTQPLRRRTRSSTLDLTIGRHSGVPLETRGALARYDAARDVLELYGAAKVPHRNRDALARMFGRSTAGVVLKEGNTGGGFGIRGELYPEDFLVCLAAMRLRAAGQMDRGPARAPDGRQPFAPAAPSGPRRGRCRRPYPGAGRRVLSRPGRLCAHPRRPRAGDDDRRCCRGRTASRPIARRPFPADQQDAGRDLSRARTLRGHLRARAAARRGRRPARPRPGRRCAGAT